MWLRYICKASNGIKRLTWNRSIADSSVQSNVNPKVTRNISLYSHLLLDSPSNTVLLDFPNQNRYQYVAILSHFSHLNPVTARGTQIFFRNNASFYSEKILAPLPTPKLEYHPLSAVRDCSFNIFAATLHIGVCSSIRHLRTRHVVVTGIQFPWEKGEVRTGFWWGNLRKRAHSEDLGVEGRIILRLIFRK